MASSAQPNNQPKQTAPYVPFKSFITALDYLQQGLPRILDRSAWPTFSGGLAGQLLAAFRFLGLIDEDYASTELLERAIDPDKRKEAIREAIHGGYHELIEIDVAQATPKQLADILGELYNVSGATHKKAMTFFLHAAKFIDLPLSPAITRKTRNSGPRRRRVAEPSIQAQAETSKTYPRPSVESHGPTKTIKLAGGITLTLTADKDAFQMAKPTRDFIFQLLGLMEDEETKVAAEPKSSGEEKDGW